MTVTMPAQMIQTNKSLNDFCCMMPGFKELYLQGIHFLQTRYSWCSYLIFYTDEIHKRNLKYYPKFNRIIRLL